jgi:hypothetical protein
MTHRSHTALVACAAFLAVAFLADASAQTLYKLVDKNGKVTYSEKPPKDFDGKVIRMDIDPNANTATLPKPTVRPEPEAARRAPAAGAGAVEAAREKVDAARKALQDARDNPGEGDIQRLGKKGGGTRPVESEEYRKRLATLEENVRKAEEELKVAQGR